MRYYLRWKDLPILIVVIVIYKSVFISWKILVEDIKQGNYSVKLNFNVVENFK